MILYFTTIIKQGKKITTPHSQAHCQVAQKAISTSQNLSKSLSVFHRFFANSKNYFFQEQ